MHATDILMNVFDGVDLDTLLNCTHICRSWRTAARCHPTFWKHLAVNIHSDWEEEEELRPGQLGLFLDRLNANRRVDSVIVLSLRFTLPSPLISNTLLPALKQHLARAEELALVVSHELAHLFWPLFQLTAPRLRSLQIIVEGETRDVPALRGVEALASLERLYLENVSLAPNISPLGHVPKALRLAGDGHPTWMPHLLAWLPYLEYLNLSTIEINPFLDACISRRDTIPTLFGSLKHLVIHDEAWLHLPPVSNIQTLHFTLRLPSLMTLRRIIPDEKLCVRIGTLHWDSGVLTVVTEDRKLIRHFSSLDYNYMLTTRFLLEVLPAGRVVMLSMSLFPFFAEMCRRSFQFPHLEKLILDIRSSEWADTETVIGAWVWDSVCCPRLGSLTLRPQRPDDKIEISEDALRRFAQSALSISQPASLKVILQRISLTQSCTDRAFGEVIQQPIETKSWEFYRSTQQPPAPVNMMPFAFLPPWLGWLDL